VELRPDLAFALVAAAVGVLAGVGAWMVLEACSMRHQSRADHEGIGGPSHTDPR
jgi:hypothetical protein